MRLAKNDPRHGTTNGYNNHHCRCEACRRAWSAHSVEYKHRTGRSRPFAEYSAERRAQMKHGTVTMYKNAGCRCDECRDVVRRERNALRAKARQRPIPGHVHGTVNGYTNYACRCEACRSAARVQRRTAGSNA